MNQSEFLNGYITALLWSSRDEYQGKEYESLEDFELSDIARTECENDCRAFMGAAAPLLLQYVEQITVSNCTPWEHAGHDFWLTRAGHGVGFWDRDLGELGDQLSEICGFGTQFPNKDAYIGDDGKVYLS